MITGNTAIRQTVRPSSMVVARVAAVTKFDTVFDIVAANPNGYAKAPSLGSSGECRFIGVPII